MPDVSFFAPKQRTPRREAERLKILAESLKKGGQYRGNEMVSGIVVKQSPLEHLARGLQTAAGGYFEGQATNKADEDERVLQERMAEALGKWGNPQEAAGILAQDPRTAEMAFKLMQGETDFARDKELAQMRISALGGRGGNTPAPMQIANQMFELEQMMNNPNLPEEQRFLAERQYNLLGQAAKTYGFDRGLQAQGMGGYDAVYGNGGQPTAPQQPPPDMQGIPPVTMSQDGQMQAPMGGQAPSMPLMPSQYPQDPVAAVQRQSVGMGEIPGYGQAAAGIAAQKAEAEAAAKSRGTFNEEGKQGLIASQRLLQSKDLQEGMLNDKISSIRDRANALTTGFTGSLTSFVPGSPGYDLRADVDTLLANAGFDRLQEMRDNSPTGGALGQVSNIELGLLQSAAQNLKASQGKEQFLRNLDNFERQRMSSLSNVKAAYEQDYQRFGGAKDSFLPPPSVPAQTAPTQDVNAEIEALERELGLR